MEAVANYNEILPGITGISFPKDLDKSVIQIKSTFRSILSRIKALQAIRTFSKKLNVFLIGEEKVEQIAQPVMEPVITEQVQPVMEPVPNPEPVSIGVKSGLSAAGAKSVMADKEISKYIMRGESMVDRTPFDGLLKQEQAPVTTSVNLEPVPHVEDSVPNQIVDLSVKLPFDIEPAAVEIDLNKSVAIPFPTVEVPVEKIGDEKVEQTIDHSVTIPFPKTEEPVAAPYVKTDLTVKVPFDIETSQSVELPVQSEQSQVVATTDKEETEKVVNSLEAIKGLRELVDTNEELTGKVRTLSTRNAELEETVRVKDGEILSLNDMLKAKEEELQTNKGQVIEFGKAVQALDRENKELREQLSTMTNAINEALGGISKAA